MDKLKRIPTLLLGFLLFFSLSHGQVSQAEKTFISNGQMYLKNSEIDKALVEFDKAVKLDPRNLEALYFRGMARFLAKDMKGAKIDFEKIIYIAPKLRGIEAVYNALGNIHYSNGDKELALTNFNKSVSINPGYSVAYVGLGNCLSDTGAPDKALEAYNTGLKLNPHLIAAYIGRGDVLFQKNQLDEALSDYDKALAMDTMGPAINLNRGMIYGLKDRWVLAISDLRNGLEINAHPTPFSGGITVSLSDLDTYISHNSTNARAWAVRGFIRLLQGHEAEAEADFQKSFQLDAKLKIEIENYIIEIKNLQKGVK